MESNCKDDSSAVGCLLVLASIGIAGAVLGANLNKDPRWLWILPVAIGMLWMVYLYHKEAIKPTDIESQMGKLRMENTLLQEERDRLTQALSGYKRLDSEERSIEGMFARERKNIEEQKRALAEIKISIESKYSLVENKENEILRERAEAAAEIQAADRALHDQWEKCWAEKSAGFPTLANLYADAWIATRRKDIDSLRSHAIKTLELRQRLGREIRDLKASEIVHRNLVSYYEMLFPELVELRDGAVPTLEDLKKDDDPDGDRRKGWLTEQEWNELQESERSQLALDRYCARRKSKWEIGVEYERFCGFRLEKQGWEVRYNGAVSGLNDLGRDLIARRAEKVLVVQCKYWSDSKRIHEKHVFQTYGTMVALRVDEPDADVSGWLATSTKLSDRARKFAKALGIGVKENDKIGEFPRIKCNAKSKFGKVYHLPFDQKYDYVVIRPEFDDFYCFSAREAEEKGFRRALKWIGD